MGERLERLHTVRTAEGDVEIGVTDAIQRHFSRKVVQRKPVSQRKLDFEARRPRWLRECLAEATGVFFYVYPGISSVAIFTMEATITAGLFQIGLGFALGIAFAIIVCAPTSGGHFNPAVTLCLWWWQGFPIRKVPYYILSQICGAFIAALLVWGQYHQQIAAFELKEQAKLGAAYNDGVYNPGPASIFCTFPNEGQSLGYLFFIEFFVDVFIGLIIWACLDPANPFISPTTAPFAIGLAYAVMVWGFAGISISTNLARDLGTRMVAAIAYGPKAFTYMNYCWISILVNIPATFVATCYYEFLMRDSLHKIGKGHAVHEAGEDGLVHHLTKNEHVLHVDEPKSATRVSSLDSNGSAEKGYSGWKRDGSEQRSATVNANGAVPSSENGYMNSTMG